MFNNQGVKMINKVFPALVIVSALFLYTGCGTSVGPSVNSNNDTTSNSGSTFSFSIDYDKVPGNGLGQINIIKHYFPDTSLNITVQKEFLLEPGDTIKVSVKNCSPDFIWDIDFGTVNISPENNWINDDVGLLGQDSTVNSDKSVNRNFYLSALKKGKGYLCFFEAARNDGLPISNGRGFIIGYTIDALDSVWVKIDTVEWFYQTSPYSQVSVRLKGTTNAYRLRGMGYGDGVASAVEIPVNDNQTFDSKYSVAFSHSDGIYLSTDTRLLLYGAPGLPKLVVIKNPRNTGQ